MATAMVSAAVSVVGKALAPVTGSLLKDWAASMELGDNVNALELELLTVQALLEPTLGREIDNSALKELLLRLQGLAYDADDVLDELDYFRIQDELDGTSEAADKHPKGFVHNLALNAKAVGKQIICLPTCLSSDAAPGAKAANRRQVNRDEEEVERFTEEQEALLFVNSLKCIHFSHCNRLQYLPARLHRLPNLKTLKIYCCHALQMLPEDGLPSSLQELEIWGCPEIHSLPKDGLPSSLQKLQIWNCPRIQWLPKVDDLPSSLRELDVRGCGSEELKMQCRKLIGIIPIVIVY